MPETCFFKTGLQAFFSFCEAIPLLSKADWSVSIQTQQAQLMEAQPARPAENGHPGAEISPLFNSNKVFVVFL
ncbi:hypothetical protein BIV59_12950 [Bacillus sp. MUM 13]|nr:hypothetical protein BIV59_12950 [Bacillus sp. MUM 13]